MEQLGRISSWNHAKGFGFIRPQAGGADVFAHISGVLGQYRPSPGDQVTFTLGRDEQGRPRAESLKLAGESYGDAAAPHSKAGPAASPGAIKHVRGKLAIFALLCCLPGVGVIRCLLVQQLVWPVSLYGLASVLCFALYWQDKASARKGRWRIAENTLHLLEVLGGWPGALLAQQLLRHKTRKLSYQLLFWLIVALHQLFWVDQLLLKGAYSGAWL